MIINRSIIIFAVLLNLFVGSMCLRAVDHEYCSLNFEKDACVSKTRNESCCWLKFTHSDKFKGPNIEGCFDYRYMINALKFVVWPNSFSTVSDSQLCNKLNANCDKIDRFNFKSVYENVVNVEESQIREVQEIVCRP
jgi:hypothetical protein